MLRLTGEGEVFYLQERLGKNGRPFQLIKFATMLKVSPSIGSLEITVQNDPRVLPVGGFLRKTKLNEIPQLINIFIGDMSFVGPRPQTRTNFDFFPPETQATIASLRPGLTGIGSIVFRDEEWIVENSEKTYEACYREDIGPHKGELERWYKTHQGIVTYLSIVFVTLWVVLRPRSMIFRRIWPSLPPLPLSLRRPSKK